MSIDTHAAIAEPRAFDRPTGRADASRGSTAIVRAETPIRHVALLVDPSRLRFAHAELARRLAEGGIRATVMHGRSRQPLPWSAELLLELERMTRRVAGPRLTDGIDVVQLMLTDACPADPPDLVIDLCEDQATRPNARTVRILYDGTPGETALMGALLAGRMPTIDIEEVETGAILATGTPCADNAGTILEAFECVLARVTTLLLTVMRNPAPLVPAERSAHSIRTRSLVAFEAKTVARSIVRRLYALCCHTPHWRTCWRFLDGPDLWQTGTLGGTTWNVIPDPGFRFYADPFPFIHQGRLEAAAVIQTQELLHKWIENMNTDVDPKITSTAASWAIYGLADQWAHDKSRKRLTVEKYADQVKPLMQGKSMMGWEEIRQLAARRDVFPDYTLDGFRAAFVRHFTIVDEAPVADSRRLVDRLVAAGADASMHEVPGAGHGFQTPATAWPDAEKAMFDWLVAHGIGK
jgi:hypothetical protein